MINAKEELIEHAEGRKFKCAVVAKGDDDRDDDHVEFRLSIDGDVDHFLNQLNFDYYEGYGSQELFGIVWWEDGTWSERREYDGSEWWEHRKVPEIPEYLK